MERINPYRGRFGAQRPPELQALRLPPEPMPPRYGMRPLKAWRYVGVYGPDVMLCAAVVRVGPARQTFWAVWDRNRQELRERTMLTPNGVVRLEYGRVFVSDETVEFDLTLTETDGVETVHPASAGYAWTRKQGGIDVTGTLTVAGRTTPIAARAVIDDTAAYYERHTQWRWSAGVGESSEGQAISWNLVEGVNDSLTASERTVWVDGVPHEAERLHFAEDLSRVGDLRFTAEAVRERNENRLLIRSRYRQPFGTFQGSLPGGIAVTNGYGVMEDHEVWW